MFSSIDQTKAECLSIFPFAFPAQSSIRHPSSSIPANSYVAAYLHDRCPEMHSLGSNRAVPDLSELALGRSLDVVGVLGGALVGAALRKAHVGVDLAGGHLGAERPDTEAGGHCGRGVWCE